VGGDVLDVVPARDEVQANRRHVAHGLLLTQARVDRERVGLERLDRDRCA
jgi:hypothetical protein